MKIPTHFFRGAKEEMHKQLYKRLLIILALVPLLNSCEIDKFAAIPTLPREQLPFTLDVKQRVIEMSTIAPYDTLTIDAAVLNVDGDRIEDAVIEFASSDSALRVSPNGKLTARLARSSVTITVVGRVNGAALAAAINVKITNNAQPDVLQSITIGRAGGDSNYLAITESISQTRLSLSVLNSNGNVVTGVTPYWWASPNSNIASLRAGATGLIQYLGPGEVMVYVTTTYYGVTLRDSIRFIMLPPLHTIVHSHERIRRSDAQQMFYFSPDTVVIGAGGIVTFSNDVPNTAMDIQFSDPDAVSAGCPFIRLCGGEVPATGGVGNIDLFEVNQSVVYGQTRSRRFSVPGTYQFWSARSLDTGVVVVK